MRSQKPRSAQQWQPNKQQLQLFCIQPAVHGKHLGRGLCRLIMRLRARRSPGKSLIRHSEHKAARLQGSLYLVTRGLRLPVAARRQRHLRVRRERVRKVVHVALRIIPDAISSLECVYSLSTYSGTYMQSYRYRPCTTAKDQQQ